MQFTVILLACLFCVTAGFTQSSSFALRVLGQTRKHGNFHLSMKVAAEELVVKPGETDDQLQARMRKLARKKMFNENGVAYAPWVANQINEDAIVEDLVRKAKGISPVQQAKRTKVSILERGEIQGSDGMRWRMSDGQVQLAWGTGGEANNKGFVVEKRSGGGGEYVEIASFKEVAQLVSKGNAGGKYSYTDPATSGGTWIYRVKDCDEKGKKDILCQCFVEVTTDGENKQQAGVLVGFLGVLGALAVAGVALNPQF